jgi:hypothetical protein
MPLVYSTFLKETRQRFSEKLCMLKTAYSAFIKNHLTPRKTSIVVMVTNMFRISLIEYNKHANMHPAHKVQEY